MVSRKFSVAILMVFLGPAAVVVWFGLRSPADPSCSLGGSSCLLRSAPASRPEGPGSTPAPFERPGATGVQGSPAMQSDQGPREALSPARDRVSLRLVRAATGEPLATTSFQIDNKRFQTDAAGRVEIERRCFFTISVDGFARTGVMVQSDKASWPDEVVVLLHPSATLQGTVVDATERPVAGTKIRVYRDSDQRAPRTPVTIHSVLEGPAVTDAAGRFCLQALPAGMPIASEAVLGSVELRNEPLVLRPHEIRSVRWTLPAWGAVRGEVVDQDGRRVPFARVALRVGNTNQALSTLQADHAGLFQFERIPCGAYRVRASSSSRSTVHGSDFPPADVAVHVRQHGSVATATVRVNRGLYVRGVVVGPDGEPLAGIMVERGCFGLAFPDSCAIHFAHPCLRSMKPSWRNALPDPIENRCFDGDLTEWASRTARSGPDGTFALGPLDPGTYRVMALEKGVYRASEFVTARAGGARVTLHVPLGGLVEGCVVTNGAGEDGLAGRIWAVRRGSTHATRAGFFIDPERNRCEFVLFGLEPGRYDLFALPGRFGYRETDSRETVAGRLDGLVIEGGAELRGLRMRLLPAGTICVHGNSPEPAGFDRSSIFTCRVMVGEATIAAALVSSSSRHKFLVPPGTYRIRLQRTVPPSTEHRVELVTVGPGQDVAVCFP